MAYNVFEISLCISAYCGPGVDHCSYISSTKYSDIYYEAVQIAFKLFKAVKTTKRWLTI